MYVLYVNTFFYFWKIYVGIFIEISLNMQTTLDSMNKLKILSFQGMSAACVSIICVVFNLLQQYSIVSIVQVFHHFG